MIKRIKIEPDLERLVECYLADNNLANRGVADGDPEQQKIGVIGEMCVVKYLTGKYPYLNEKVNGFDGGYDIEYKGRFIDVKVKVRSVFTRPNHDNSVYRFQSTFKADTFVFCSYNTVEKIIEIIGWIDKRDMIIPERFRPAGTKQKRDNGSLFIFRHDDYVIENKDLIDIDFLTLLPHKVFFHET